MNRYFHFVLSILLVGAVFFVVYPVIADDFNDPQTGELNGQDGWSDVWNSLIVQDEVVFEGDGAVENQSQFGGATYKELGGAFVESGVVSIKIRIEGNSFSDNQDLFGLYKGIGEEFIALFRFANNFDSRENMLLLSVAGSTDARELGQITQGEWHKISLGWRKSDFQIRFKVDNQDWSEWFDSQTTWSKAEPFGVRVTLPASSQYGNFYLDDIRSILGLDDPEYDPVLLTEEQKRVSEPVTTVEPLVSPAAEDQTDKNSSESIISPEPISDDGTTEEVVSEVVVETPSLLVGSGDNEETVTSEF